MMATIVATVMTPSRERMNNAQGFGASEGVVEGAVVVVIPPLFRKKRPPTSK